MIDEGERLIEYSLTPVKYKTKGPSEIRLAFTVVNFTG